MVLRARSVIAAGSRGLTAVQRATLAAGSTVNQPTDTGLESGSPERDIEISLERSSRAAMAVIIAHACAQREQRLCKMGLRECIIAHVRLE
jgi:hypothetical protein